MPKQKGKLDRRGFMKQSALACAGSAAATQFAGTQGAMAAEEKDASAQRPNILWISIEDIGPMLGCYGDAYARTPNMDQLAKDGIMYTHAYSIGCVCSPSRSSIITGMYPSSLGSMHHRSSVAPPDFLKMFPHYLRQAGYFTTNHTKKDYNMRVVPENTWDASDAKAHWRNRPNAKQPFFSVFNLTECHSSITKIAEDQIVRARLSRLEKEDFHDPAEAPIPPYHPDVPAFRKAWSRYHDAVTQVDYRVGDLIAQLKEDGLWQDTIVFLWADHGVGMLRGKQWLWEQGTRVPLLVRFPEKFQHLAPAGRGAVLDEVVTLMDLGPSALHLAGLEAPDHMHGKPLFSQGGERGRPYAIGLRDRMDTRFDLIRSVRDRRFRYQRNFYPHLPYFPYENYIYGAKSVQKWDELARQGKLAGPQKQLALRFRPVEELYDSETDPHLVDNLADNPKYKEVLDRMRGQLYAWMIDTRDLGLLDEPEMLERAAGRPPWRVGQEIENYARILETADLHRLGQGAAGALIARAADPDAAVRFWSITGLGIIRSASRETLNALRAALDDASVSVRIAAAQGLFDLDRHEDGLAALIGALEHPLLTARARAAAVLDSQAPSASKKLRPALEPLRRAIGQDGEKELNWQFRYPMERAIKAITGEATYYRWR